MNAKRVRMGRAWGRLGVFEVAARSESEMLDEAIENLERARGANPRALTDDDLRTAAGFLRRLRNNRKAMAALIAKPGRPNTTNDSYDMALAYLARKKRLGKGKSKVARSDVAKAWRRKPKTVTDAFSKFRSSVEYYLEYLIGGKDGKVRVSYKQPDDTWCDKFWTRDELLDAVYLDLKDQRTARQRTET